MSSERSDEARSHTELIDAAITARGRAYAPYSKFAVGAAVRAADGRIFAGCNVENASYGLSICAERVAIFTAIAGGATQFDAIAIATSGATTPCGACRQVMAEFAGDLPILLVDADDRSRVVETTLGVLLPSQFRLR